MERRTAISSGRRPTTNEAITTRLSIDHSGKKYPLDSRPHRIRGAIEDASLVSLGFLLPRRPLASAISEEVINLASASRKSKAFMDARDLAQEHLEAVRVKLNELKAPERSIAGFVKKCAN